MAWPNPRKSNRQQDFLEISHGAESQIILGRTAEFRFFFFFWFENLKGTKIKIIKPNLGLDAR